jgi:hypothetical protein
MMETEATPSRLARYGAWANDVAPALRLTSDTWSYCSHAGPGDHSSKRPVCVRRELMHPSDFTALICLDLLVSGILSSTLHS